MCDDEEQYRSMLCIHIQEYMNNRFISYNITTASSPSELISHDMRFDLAFLDIQMNDMDGISLAKELKKANSKIALFFVTNYEEYQDDAMDVNAFRFFSKPFDVARLYSGLDKAMEYIDGAYIDIFLNGGSYQQRLLVDNILYITRLNRKVLLKTTEYEITVSDNYNDLCSKMSPLFFYQVHKSFFVNLHYVTKYSYTELYLSDGTRIPIAPRKQSAFHKYWFEYLRRR